jgi:hypothetical protein
MPMSKRQNRSAELCRDHVRPTLPLRHPDLCSRPRERRKQCRLMIAQLGTEINGVRVWGSRKITRPGLCAAIGGLGRGCPTVLAQALQPRPQPSP